MLYSLTGDYKKVLVKTIFVDGKGFKTWCLSYLTLDTIRLGCRKSHWPKMTLEKDSCSGRFQETGRPLILVSNSSPLIWGRNLKCVSLDTESSQQTMSPVCA